MSTNSKDNKEPEISLHRFIKKEAIAVNLKGETSEEIISELANLLYENNKALHKHNKQDLINAVLDRENIQSTGMGKKIAFPHARISGLDDFHLAIGISRKGIDFKSIDREDVNIVCLMLSPNDKAYIILKVMAALSRFFYDDKRRNDFISAETVLDVLKVFEQGNINVSSRILAADIMRGLKSYVREDECLQETARKMHLNHLDALPVVDNNMALLGTVSSLDIFRFGIPDFFSQLKTVSFVRHIDPFEKYFQNEIDVTVGDIYKKGNDDAISADATLMEIIFEMTTNNHSKLFVVEDGILKGVIDRFNIIDKILIS